MSGLDFVGALKKKLKSQGADLADETGATLIFKISGGPSFSLPKPLDPDAGWTPEQQEYISAKLEFLGLEFWPLDFN